MSRGAIRQLKGDYEGTIADYTKVMSLEPKSIRGFIARAYAHYLKHDSAGAAADCEKALVLGILARSARLH